MDIASVLGLAMCLVLVIFGIVFDKDAGIVLSNLVSFVDVPSILITFGGSFSCILASYTLPNYLAGLKSIKLIFKMSAMDVPDVIKKIIELSNVARKEGLLSLEEAASDIDDDFLKKGILLIVDGTDPELVRAIMETELVSVEGRHKDKIGFWENLGAMGPAWGMIGTLIGLINMLKKMDDPSAIGPSMAVALITTLYGSILANWICAPVASKLKAKNADEMMVKEIEIEGLLSIQAGENPRVIEEKLKSFLAPADRGVSEEGGGELMNLLLCFFVLLFSMSTVDAEKWEKVVASFNQTFSVFTAGATAIGDGILISNGVSQLNELDEYINSTGKMDDGEIVSEDVAAAQAQIEEAQMEESEELAEMIQEAVTEKDMDEMIDVEFTSQYVQLTLKGALLFDSGSTLLKDEALPVLDQVGLILERYADGTIEIEGHTDNVPMSGAKYSNNDELSSGRALSVFNYLLGSTNLNPANIKHAGRGEYLPVADNATAEGRSKNRRVEIKIYNSLSSY